MAEEKNLPESFNCPLTHELMVDPVVDHEGNSYERTAIEAWLEKNQTSPITRAPLSLKDLVPNRALRTLIEEKCKELGIELKKPEPSKKAESKKEDNNAASSGQDVKISATASQSTANSDEYDVLVTIQPPQGEKRTPTDVCCVIDVSGSMGTEAKMKNATGGTEAHGLSLLDIVLHAVKTVIHTLHPEDRLALVTYSDTAKVICELTSVDAKNKANLLKKVETICTEGCTNLWDGLHTGLELLREKSASGRLTSLLLLTDGLPNVNPPRGELFMLKKYKEQYSRLSCTINTFGFGYDINSELLREIAIEGGGMYSFIPDSSFVGTAFVNALSNLLVTMAKNVQLTLEPMNGATLVDTGVYGGHSHNKASWGTQVDLYSLQYGQTKDIVVKMTLPKENSQNLPYLSATVKYQTKDSTEQVQTSVEATHRAASTELQVQKLRLRFVDTVREAMELVKNDNYHGARKLVANFLGEIQKNLPADPRAKTLVEDLKGQVTEAFSKPEFYTKWGVHYLPSLMRAHLLQQCNNFKDPGIQHFGGKLFQKLRDEVDDIFVKLPPPKPSVKSSSRSYNPPTSMQSYHSSGNPCFDGDCVVTMGDGTEKSVKNLVKGDIVMTPNGVSEIVCIVKTVCQQGKTPLVALPGGLLVTPYHPIRMNNQWNFPIDLAQAVERPCPAVYSFVLKATHVMIINGVECVTLGHGLNEDVVSHPYFGTQRVIEDLKQMRGWSNGLVTFNSGCLLRDLATGLVCGFNKSSVPAVDSTSSSLVV